MKKFGLKTRMTAALMAAMMIATAWLPQMVKADAVERPYLSLGADLRSDEKDTVFRLLGVDGDHLDQYEVMTVTNADEHDYLDNYLSASVIGSRALSSVLIEKMGKGNGIQVTTKNITYCSEGMYQNALSTAGITDANVTVAGPFNLTGTAALVGAMKAYEDMTGEYIDEEAKDAATNELVVTGDLAEEIGDSETAEKFIAMVKQFVIENNLTSKEDIKKAIDDSAEKLEIKLTEEQKAQITELMDKIKNLDINVEQLKEQAKAIYDKLSQIEIDGKGFFDGIMAFFHKLFKMFGME